MNIVKKVAPGKNNTFLAKKSSSAASVLSAFLVSV